MKLIDLLVKELPKRGGWPAGATECYWHKGFDVAHFYDATGNGAAEPIDVDGVEWCGSDGYDVKVTRYQYEAALAKNDDWIEWHGGKCPVDSDAIVEVRYRKPNPYQFNNDRAGDFTWSHDGFDGDIIAYRLQQPTKSEQVRADAWHSYAGITENDEEADLNECIGQDVVTEWNGDGLPPVGTICMANLANGWTDVKVAYIGDEGGCREALVFEIESTKPAWADEFRPLRTEAEKLRDEAGLALYHAINWNAEGEMVSPSRMEDYKKAYDAIAAGKIPGVKLEGK